VAADIDELAIEFEADHGSPESTHADGRPARYDLVGGLRRCRRHAAPVDVAHPS
jgi:hypothetical protein